MDYTVARLDVSLNNIRVIDHNTTVRANSLRALGHARAGSIRDKGEMKRLLNDAIQIVRARSVEAMAFVFSETELESISEFNGTLAEQLANNNAYNAMMANRAEIRLGRNPTNMEATCIKLLDSKSNWQVWEAVDAMAELNPRPGWVTTLLRQAAVHHNGAVRGKAEAALAVHR